MALSPKFIEGCKKLAEAAKPLIPEVEQAITELLKENEVLKTRLVEASRREADLKTKADRVDKLELEISQFESHPEVIKQKRERLLEALKQIQNDLSKLPKVE